MKIGSARTVAVALLVLALPSSASAQATVADYQRAMGLHDKYDGLTVHTADAPRWIEQTNRFYCEVASVMAAASFA